MAIDPPGSLVSFTVGTGDPVILAVNQIILSARTEDLTRLEHSAEIQQKAKEEDGADAVFQTGANNVMYQLFNGCGTQTPRPTIPDDAVLQDIFQRFDVVTIQMKGTDSLPEDVSAVAEINKTHLPFYSKLTALQKYVKHNVSIIKLLDLQNEDYSFLTNTSLTVAAAAMAASFTNCLIKRFEIDPTEESPDDASALSSTVYQAWTAEIEAIGITFAESTSWAGQ